MKVLLGVSIILYLVVFFIILRYDPFGDNPAAEAVSISLLVFFGFIIFVMGLLKYQMNIPLPSVISGSPPQNIDPMYQILINFLFASFIIGVIIAITVLSVQYSNASPTLTNGIVLVLNVMLTIGVIAFLVKMIRGNKKLDDNNTIWSLIKNIILYIPCILIDVIEYIKYQYSITTSTTWIILAIDIGIILAKMYVPTIYKFLFDVRAKQLLMEPQYLNNKRILASYSKLVPQPKNDENVLIGRNEDHYNYSYAVSMWIYINPQPPSTSKAYNEFTHLFNFGDKPAILYKGATNTLKVIMKLNDSNTVTIYENKEVLLQKWNSIVLNYDGGTLDIFLNNELVVSKSGVVPYMKFDNIEVGEINGVHGGICNVKYFEKALKKKSIDSIYNTAKNKNPPIF